MKHNIHTQGGAILVISLLILAVITIISITGMRTATVEEKLSANLRDNNVAFQAAERGLLAGENWILAPGRSLNDLTGANGLLQKTDPTPDFTDYATWNNVQQAAGIQVDDSGAVVITPSYIIQHVGQHDDPNNSLTPPDHSSPATNFNNVEIFRVVSRSQGLSPNAQVTLQSYFARSGI